MEIRNAIEARHLLSFHYDGYRRVVEPHTYGIDSKGHRAVRAYQTTGGSESGETTGWKLFHEDKMKGVTVLQEAFHSPRPGYRRGDQAFRSIYAQL